MVINFPAGPTTSCARNGFFKSAGLMVQPITANADPAKHEFWFQAVTTKGVTATGYYSVPVAQMPELIAAMQKMLHEYHAAQGSVYGYEPVVELANQSNGRLMAALPCGREVHLRRDTGNIGTVVEVLAGPNAEQSVQTLTYFDADNTEDEDGNKQCRACTAKMPKLIQGKCSTCFLKD